MNIHKNIKKIGSEVLLNEAEALKKIAGLLDDNFENCVKEILNLKGRVIISGIGKSAIIANKIVATLNSTGTPSIFMHAADAIHGDLGMVQDDDLVICISKSGNTPEIKVLVPLVKRTGVKLAALVSNTKSYLAENADFVLDATIESEACINNLAPTTSTTAHLAMGDALAVALQEVRGFGSEDFAKYHPGGALGKRLYLKVDEIVSLNEKPKVQEDTDFREVILEISTKRLGATAVVDKEGKLKGIITDGDIRRTLEKHNDTSQVKASDIMGANPKTLEIGSYATEALSALQENDITQLIIVEGDKPRGFVHLHDLLKEGII
ncbi:MAG: KpsF/GutQ family sugar-phosphate isomerase [Bacteroidota bacterium]